MVQSNTESRNQSKEPVTENEDGDLGWARLRRPLCLAGHFTFYPVGSRESLGIWRNDMVLLACWEGNLQLVEEGLVQLETGIRVRRQIK